MQNLVQTLVQEPTTLIGIVLSITSLITAIIQTLRIRKAKREQKLKTWSFIASMKSLMEDMEVNDPEQAAGKVYELFRSMLREAILLEESISIKKLNRWRMIGKLSSDW